MTHGFPAAFLTKYLTGCISHCCIVGDNHGIDVHILITQSNEQTSHQSLLEKCKPYLGPSASQDQNLSLGWFGFLAFFRRTRKVIITRSWSLPMSAPGKLLVLWMCQLLIGSASSPRCNQSGCGVSHLGCAMSILWMVCEGKGCLSVLGCQRLQTLLVRDLSHLSRHCRRSTKVKVSHIA